MSLATELLRQVQEAKKAQDEMGVPSYDNLNTPNNHVGNTSNATKERKVSGLGDRKVKHPTANIGTPHKEKGRDMEGVKSVKVSEAAVQDLGLKVSGGMLRFNHPGTGQEYQIEWDADAQNFLSNMMRRTQDTEQVFELLMDYMESGPGQDPRAYGGDRHPDADVDVGTDPMIRHRGGSYDPRNRPAQLAASKGTPYPLGEDMFGGNPVAQALSMRPVEGGKVYMASPDGKAAMLVPMSGPVKKAMHAYMTNPDARADTHAAAARLFQLIGQKVPGVEATQPQGPAASKSMSGVKGRGVSPDAGSGLSLAPMDTGDQGDMGGPGVNPYSRTRVTASVGESAHKTADGEMSTPKVAKPSPAHSSRVRGKQDDEPTNRGNPGTGREEKGQKKPQFTNKPAHTRGGTRGENENKTMKKMHEDIAGLEDLLGRKLQLKGTETA